MNDYNTPCFTNQQCSTKRGKRPNYTSSNAHTLRIHPPEYGCVVPAALPIRPAQQCAGLFLAMGGY